MKTIETNFDSMWMQTKRGVAGSNDTQATLSFVNKQHQRHFLRELPIGLRADIAFEARSGETSVERNLVRHKPL